MTKKNELQSQILYVVIVLIFGGLAVSWLSASPLVLYTDRPCYYGFDGKSDSQISLDVYNKGSEMGYADVCVSSKEFVFKNNNGDYSRERCYSDVSLPPKETELRKSFSFSIKPDLNIIDTIKNASYTFQINCNQRVWGLLSKSCESITWTCNYAKEGQYNNQYLRKVE